MFKIRKFDLLVSLYIFCILTSEILGIKTFPLIKIWSYQLNASVAIFVFPIIFTINDMIIEVFGKERARSVARAGIVIVALLFLFSLLATTLPPSTRFAAMENSYDLIFKNSARIALASLIAITLSEFTDIFIFTKIRQKMGEKALWFRNNVSNFIAQFIDTSVFIVLAFYAFNNSLNENMVFLFSLILPYWFLKCLMSVVETPFVYLGIAWLRGGEKK